MTEIFYDICQQVYDFFHKSAKKFHQYDSMEGSAIIVTATRACVPVNPIKQQPCLLRHGDRLSEKKATQSVAFDVAGAGHGGIGVCCKNTYNRPIPPASRELRPYKFIYTASASE
jgi:hypothetical protein